MEKRPQKPKVVYYNQQSGDQIYKCEETNKFYWHDGYKWVESDKIEPLIEAEKSLDPRAGWN